MPKWHRHADIALAFSIATAINLFTAAARSIAIHNMTIIHVVSICAYGGAEAALYKLALQSLHRGLFS